MSTTVHLVAVDAHEGGALTACGSSDEPVLVVSDRSLCDCRRCLMRTWRALVAALDDEAQS